MRCIYRYHRSHPLVLTDEPKHLEETALGALKERNEQVQTSILEFTGILRSKSGEWVKQGEEPLSLDIGMEGHDETELADGEACSPVAPDVVGPEQPTVSASDQATIQPDIIPPADERTSSFSFNLPDPVLLDPFSIDGIELGDISDIMGLPESYYGDFTFDFLDSSRVET